eukprot:m.364356 g.364356  ORF g.364356 m.364356 type:complete len:151 (+) comp26734_c0_seq1:49-501(+)
MAEGQETTVDKEAWLKARLELLAEEKQLSKEIARVAAKRAHMPWYKLPTEYTFHSVRMDGQDTLLADMFEEGSSELIVQHMMLGVGQDSPCFNCSFFIDQILGCIDHLRAKNVSYAIVAKAGWKDMQRALCQKGWVGCFSGILLSEQHIQ